MRIYVNNKDYGFLTQEPITIQRFADDSKEDLLWCNHAGAEEVKQENQINRIDQPDIVWTDKIMVCKCGAYRFEFSDFWEDCPIEGEQ